MQQDNSNSSAKGAAYNRIATAIEYILDNADSQPTLDQIAEHVHLSPFHFQRLFSQWAGITPKRFLQALTLERAKLLLDQSISLNDASNMLGLTSSSRLYDHFVNIEAMTPGEYKKKGEGLSLEYGTADTPFGKAFIAMTDRGISKLSFLDESELSLESTVREIEKDWQNATLKRNDVLAAETLKTLFNEPTDSKSDAPISLYVRGTNFQVNVWRSLINIPYGQLVSYSHLANSLENPKASRAIGTAVGANPVGFLIPCHRVIQQSGKLGGYRWGLTRKQAILTFEASQRER